MTFDVPVDLTLTPCGEVLLARSIFVTAPHVVVKV